MRDVRKTYTKTYDSSPQGVSEGSSFSGNASKVRFTNCPTQSVWFSDFLLGAEDRMGYDTKKQKYLQMPVVLKQLELIKRDAEFADVEESKALHKFGALIAILTAGSLRGHEGLYVDLSATRKYLSKGKNGVLPANALKRV
jgi:hypothetical protein